MELWRRRFLTIDPRTLAALRVALALLLLLDFGKRVADVSTWYTNAGLLPNHRLLWRPETQHQISYLYACACDFDLCSRGSRSTHPGRPTCRRQPQQESSVSSQSQR